MVGMIESDSLARVTTLVNSVAFPSNNHSKLQSLNQLKLQLLQDQNDAVLISPLIPSLLNLISDRFCPVRKCAIEIIGEIGLRHVEFLPKIIHALSIVVDDDTPAVGRQAITSGTTIFCRALQKIALEELNIAEQADLLESTWASVQKLKEKIYSIAFQSESDGRRLLALKFIAAVILIYTPDPNGSTDQPPRVVGDDNAKELGFSIAWLRRGHPILKLGDLSIEASQSLGLLLDQLRPPIVKSLSTSMVVILINCLSAIAIKRPSFYGRILPVLLGLDPSNSVIKGLHAYGVQHALKNAFLSCLKCTHPSAIPWRDRLVGALRDMKAGELAEEILGGELKKNVKEEKVDSVPIKEEQSPEVSDSVGKKTGRKRLSEQNNGERSEDDDTPGKRARSMPTPSEELSSESNVGHTGEVKLDPTAQATMSEKDDLGPVQQLLGLFGTLVAQGEKAAASLEILVAGISADLLAEVVIANLRNLPSTCPVVDDDKFFTENKVDSDIPFRQLSSFLTTAVSHNSSLNMSSGTNIRAPTSDDIESHPMEESRVEEMSNNNVSENDVVNANSIELAEKVHSDVPFALPSGSHLGIVSESQDNGTPEAVIPGLDDARSDGQLDAITSSSFASMELDDAGPDQVSSFGLIPKLEPVPSISTEMSEELSSKTAFVESSAGIASTATSTGPTAQLVLPKLSAPLVDLSDEDKDMLQKSVFVRILEAYKQVAVAGGSQLRFSVLACLGVEFPLDLDPWALLQTHILSDYLNHEGHELTVQVLYRLYGEAEEERDFFSSTTASSVYEAFLLKVSETLRDSFPASDKSLSRLLGEVPYLPESILKLLECLCCPEHGDKDEKELHSGDRVTQGLSAVWSLISLRPTLRKSLLRIALQSAVHHMEEVRMKAIRLVANKLYPLSSAVLQIEKFAKDMLVSIVDTSSGDNHENEKASMQSQKNFDTAPASSDQMTLDLTTKNTSACTTQLKTPEGVSSTSLSEAQRCMSLYFALCTKKHTLLRQVFTIYKSSPESVKQAIDGHMPILIRTMGASPSLLGIISDPPDGSENLLIQVLHTLTDGTVPSAELISTVKKLYESKIKNVEILFPILSFLTNEEVLRVFPHVVNLPQEKFQAALTRLLQGSTPSGPLLTPAQVLIAIHGIDPEKDGIPLKKVTDACNSCFEKKQIFTQQVIAAVLNHLVEQIPLPLLFMRTVLQAIGAFPALVNFIMEILARLVSKQIWKNPKLWVGFLKCAQLTQPHSFSVLLQLPQAQLEGALKKIGALKAPLAAHASQPNLKATLPRSILVVLGIASDPEGESQPQPSGQLEAGDAGNSEKDNTSDKGKESSAGG
ncbi:uncharacterized protein LOC141607581 [Silene latifolia]|uniref:uncharacterized protein LOC141607581 n=1 Tax=Silene latifolia TaxID=37657 RepID=UPI003D77A8C0